MYGISHIRSVSVGLYSQIWYLFIYITGYLNVRKISETIDFRTFVGPLPYAFIMCTSLYCYFELEEVCRNKVIMEKLKVSQNDARL